MMLAELCMNLFFTFLLIVLVIAIAIVFVFGILVITHCIKSFSENKKLLKENNCDDESK